MGILYGVSCIQNSADDEGVTNRQPISIRRNERVANLSISLATEPAAAPAPAAGETASAEAPAKTTEGMSATSGPLKDSLEEVESQEKAAQTEEATAAHATAVATST